MGILKEFRDFAARGNVIDLAVGVIIGAAFGKIVASLVADIVMPPIGMLLGGVDFSNLFVALNRATYATLAEAKAAGAPTINYGVFLNTVLRVPDRRLRDLPARAADQPVEGARRGDADARLSVLPVEDPRQSHAVRALHVGCLKFKSSKFESSTVDS